MSNIENLFKHKFPFKLETSFFAVADYASSLTSCWTNDTTKDSIGVYPVDDLFNKLKPFISFLQSVATVTTYRGVRSNKTTYHIYLNANWRLCKVFTIVIDEIDPNIKISKDETGCNICLRYSFKIRIDVKNVYPIRRILEQESSSESDDDDDEYNDDNNTVEPKPLEESFRIDKCVICLETEPNILLTDCNHICTCSECEKIKPSVKCPYCRTEISRRIKIFKIIFFIFFFRKVMGSIEESFKTKNTILRISQ